jgi:outer membrane protein
VSAPVFAQGKIVVLDPRAAMLNTKVAQERIKKMQAEPKIVEALKEMEGLQKGYKDMVTAFQKDQATMKQDKKEAEIKKIQAKQQEIETLGRQLQGADQQLQQMVAQELGEKMKEVVKDIIKNDGIGLLLNREAVIHMEPSYDITAKVTEKLNQAK